MSTELFEVLLMGWAIASVYVALNSEVTNCKNRFETLASFVFGSPMIVLILVTVVFPWMIKDAILKNALTFKRSMTRPLWQWAAISAVCCATAGTIFGLSR